MLRSLRRGAPTFRLVRADEAAFVAGLARTTLSGFGRYDELLPEWMKRAGIFTFAAVLRRRPVGLCMLGFFEDPARGLYADLLAVAVAPEAQGRGVGRALLRFAVAESQSRMRGVKELRLSVADTNRAARELFSSEGFELCPYELGVYAQGQVALRMARRFEPSAQATASEAVRALMPD